MLVYRRVYVQICILIFCATHCASVTQDDHFIFVALFLPCAFDAPGKCKKYFLLFFPELILLVNFFLEEQTSISIGSIHLRAALRATTIFTFFRPLRARFG